MPMALNKAPQSINIAHTDNVKIADNTSVKKFLQDRRKSS